VTDFLLPSKKHLKTMNYPRLAFVLTTFSFLTLACAQSESSGSTKTMVRSADQKIDTTLQLKFTSGVRAILEDSQGNFWFGSHQEGVALVDGEKLTYFTVEDGLSHNQIRSIYEDEKGRIWLEGAEGVSRYEGGKIVTVAQRNYDAKQDWQISENDLWFKADESSGYNQLEGGPGAYRYDGKELSYHLFPVDSKEEPFYYSVSTPFVRGKGGKVWFGTYGAVFGYDGTSFTMIDDERLGLNDETGHFHVRSIYEDTKGNLWIGNNGIGVWRFDGDTTINVSKSHGLVSVTGAPPGGHTSGPNTLEHVFSIGEDLEGNLWFGDRDTGAWRFDGTSFTNFTIQDGLTTHHIWDIYTRANGELWFAMGDGSVCRFNGESFDRIF
jgi:ligand-binding sensor domain-containing protein